MIGLSAHDLPAEAIEALRVYQAEVDSIEEPDARYRRAESLFRNRQGTPVFGAVREHLDRMCPGKTRCMYCEDSAANQIEHFRPKRWYPGLVFAWENFLYACSGCNMSKGSIFEVRCAGVRMRVDKVVEADPGHPLLIDPRSEDPTELIRLELETFLFEPSHPTGTLERERADFTIQLLDLNREPVRVQRESAYSDYLLRLRSHVEGKMDQASFTRAISRLHHPTVWKEMERRREDIADLKDLFDRLPRP
jgi:uncharacterized protein (TIGR02646 family)